MRIALYGSSLFLSAIAAALAEYGTIEVIQFPDPVDICQIILQKPCAVLWRSQGNRPDVDGLQEAGIWLLEVDERKSMVSASHQTQKSPQHCMVLRSADLVQFIKNLENILSSPSHSRRHG